MHGWCEATLQVPWSCTHGRHATHGAGHIKKALLPKDFIETVLTVQNAHPTGKSLACGKKTDLIGLFFPSSNSNLSSRYFGNLLSVRVQWFALSGLFNRTPEEHVNRGPLRSRECRCTGKPLWETFFWGSRHQKKNESLSLRRKQYSVTGAVGFCDELVEVKDRTFCKKNIAASITDSGLIGVRKMNPGIWHEHSKRQSPDVQRVASET